MTKQQQKKSMVRLSPLNCELCKRRNACMYGTKVDELYRLGLTIRLEDCADYNGGMVVKR